MSKGTTKSFSGLCFSGKFFNSSEIELSKATTVATRLERFKNAGEVFVA